MSHHLAKLKPVSRDSTKFHPQVRRNAQNDPKIEFTQMGYFYSKLSQKTIRVTSLQNRNRLRAKTLTQNTSSRNAQTAHEKKMCTNTMFVL